MADKIISKGFYTYPGIPNFVGVKQYIMVRSGKENHLFFRFENPKNDRLTAISFSVDCYDSEGRIIKTAKIEQTNLKIKGHSCFVVSKPVVVDGGCVDFKVSINSVAYGDFCYITHGNEIEVLYEKQNNDKEVDRVPFLHKLGGNTHKAAPRTLHTPRFFISMVSVIIFTLFLILGIKIYNFTRTEVLFSLDKVEYTFATDNRKDGPIIIVGCKSNAANIIVPDEIEGHDVLAIASNAFEDTNVRTIQLNGTIEIRDYAFSGASKLQKVTIESTQSIDQRAFYNCSELTEVSVTKDLNTIEQSAFENCPSLVRVSFPDSLKSIGDRAFSGCSSLASLTLPENTSKIGERILYGCYALKHLEVPYIGSSPDNIKTLAYFYGTKSTPYALTDLTVTTMTTIPDGIFAGEAHLENVSFDASVTYIGANAFSNCRALNTFKIPSTVEEIGEGAFLNCSSLTEAAIPDKVSIINNNLFNGCSSLKSVTIPRTVTYVGDYAFYNCRKLVALDLPECVAYVGNSAIQNCTGLTTLVLPYLGNTATDSPRTLNEIITSGEYCSLKNFTLYSGTALPDYTFSGFRKLESVSLPEEIETIGSCCFEYCNNLDSVTIPANVTYIGDYAFQECYALRSIELPELVEHVGSYAFFECRALSSISFHNNSTEIGNGIFNNCSSLTYINLPSDIASLPYEMCSGCTSLETIVLPANVTNIPQYAFYNCASLKSVVLPTSLTTIDYNSFAYCTSLESFAVPSTVTIIGSYAFSNCASLESVTIPESVISLGSYAFYGCNTMTSITAPFPTKFSYGSTFNYYFGYEIPVSLKSVTLSDVYGSNLPSNAFLDFASLEELTLPDGLLTIGQNAFKNCSSLTSLTIPDSVTSMGTGMLYGTNALRSITLPYAGVDVGSSTGFREFFYGSYYNSYYGYYDYEYRFPSALDSVTLTKATKIPGYAFQSMSTIHHINIPDTVTRIEDYAFSGCTSLNEVTLPSNLTYVGYYAFTNCYRLYEVTNLSTVGISVPNAKRIFSSELEKATNKVTRDGFSFIRTTNNEWYLTDYDHTKDAHNLPGDVRYNGAIFLYEIPNYLFYNDSAVKSISIPTNVTAIGEYAFQNCYSLSSVTFENGSQLKTIGRYAFNGTIISDIKLPYMLETISECAFYDCYYLSSVTFENGSQLKTIGRYAFNETIISDINLPYTLETIGEYAFYGCYRLKSVSIASNSRLETIGNYAFTYTILEGITIPSSLRTIGEGAFQDVSTLVSVSFNTGSQLDSIGKNAFCGTSIKGITLPSSLRAIGESAFYNVSSLESVSFQENSRLVSIGQNAFRGTSIVELNLPSTVTTIEDYAFGSCTSLAVVTINSKPSISYNAFSGCSSLLEIYNLGGMSLFIGSSENGHLAYHAMIIHTRDDAERLTDVVVNGFRFKKSDDNWFLMGLADGNNTTELVLRSFDHEGLTVSSYVVWRYAFQYNTNITSVTIGSAVREIMYSAFYECTQIRSLNFDNDCTITSIGSYAFYDCYRIDKVSIPSTVTSIGDYAFCGCYSLYDVMNSSNLNISKGSTSNGYVGYYALAVRNSKVPLATQTVTNDSVTALFAKLNTSWYLVGITINNGYGLITIPELVVDDEVTNYQITAYALHSPTTYYYGIVIPDSVSKIEDNALSYITDKTIYFHGNENKWSNLDKYNYAYYVYLYTDCVHEDYTWTYDLDGAIRTAELQLTETVIKEPTCKEVGELKLSCPNCSYERTSEIEITTNHVFEDDECTVCGKMIIVVTSANFGDIALITNNSSTPFAIDSAGVITSQNHGNNTTSTMSITATETMTVTFSYTVSSENGWDYLTISVNSYQVAHVSGTDSSYSSMTLTLYAGDVLTFSYYKDGSQSYGNDCAYIKDLTLVY